MPERFSSVSIDQLMSELASSPEGLPSAIAEDRVKKQASYFKKESLFVTRLKLFMRQFTSPLVLLLAIAVILSATLGESSDAIIILVILFTTGLFGFFQELNAGRAMEKLKGMIELKHTVLRNKQELQLGVHEIVPGDVLLLDAGDVIPADCRLIESKELHVNESTITGESFPVEKMTGEVPDEAPLNQKTNCLWQGTNVISGTASALVVQTGNDTIFGKLAHSLVQTPETAFEKGIKRFGYFLLRVTVILATAVLVINLYFKKPLFDSILFSLALAVGMTPELLPAIMTFAMSIGAKKMLQKKVIVKKLSSIFNFGEVNLLCTDKTGTITEGNVIVKDMVDPTGAASNRIREFAYLNSFLQKGFTNPIDEAITALALPVKDYKKLDEIPYDFIRKRLSIAVSLNNESYLITKGAFDQILEISTQSERADGQVISLDQQQQEQLREQFIQYSQQGYRVLGLCYKKITVEKINREAEKDMVFLGFILLEDPLKESALASIKRLKELHIDVKIITGDNRFAAAHTANRLGIPTPVILTGQELQKLDPQALIVKARDKTFSLK